MSKIIDMAAKQKQDRQQIVVKLSVSNAAFLLALVASRGTGDTADLLVTHARGKKEATGGIRVNIAGTTRSPNGYLALDPATDVYAAYCALKQGFESIGLTYLDDPMKDDVRPSTYYIGGVEATYPGKGTKISVGCETEIEAIEVEKITKSIEDVVRQLDNIGSLNHAVVDTLTFRNRLVQVVYERHGTTKIRVNGLADVTLSTWKAFNAWVKAAIVNG